MVVVYCQILGYGTDLVMVRSTLPLFALIIGIDKYFLDRIRNLSGAVANANAISTFLQETLGVPQGQIKDL